MPKPQTNPSEDSKDFIPLGAITFLFTTVLVYAGIWFSIFALMAARG